MKGAKADDIHVSVAETVAATSRIHSACGDSPLLQISDYVVQLVG
jgi:hypothetical protein